MRFSKKIIVLLILMATASLSYAQEDTKPCECDARQISKGFTQVAKKAIPAVVFIKATGVATQQDMFGGDESLQNPFEYFGDDFLHRFFGIQPKKPGSQKQPSPQVSQGSGFIISADGHVITNAHVVKGSNKITVVLNDARELEATIVGADPHTDVAVLKVEATDLPFVNFGNSDELEIGEWVVAIGSPFQLEATLTVGVVSAKGRENLKINTLEDFIQTDAAINPGNSGGPLLDLNSNVIGINTAIVSQSGGYMGISFAIPSKMAKHVVKQIIENGSVVRGFLGVSLQPVDTDIAEAFNLEKPEGALVAEVIKDSPADRGGIKQGDIILEYNDIPVKNPAVLQKGLSFMEPDTTVTFKINRKGTVISVSLKIGKSSDQISASGGVVQQLGMEVENLTPEIAKQIGVSADTEGVVITRIKPSSTAAQAGLRPGFMILAINHKKIKNVDEFNEAINEQASKKRLLILARQGNVTRFYSIKLD